MSDEKPLWWDAASGAFKAGAPGWGKFDPDNLAWRRELARRQYIINQIQDEFRDSCARMITLAWSDHGIGYLTYEDSRCVKVDRVLADGGRQTVHIDHKATK